MDVVGQGSAVRQQCIVNSTHTHTLLTRVLASTNKYTKTHRAGYGAAHRGAGSGDLSNSGQPPPHPLRARFEMRRAKKCFACKHTQCLQPCVPTQGTCSPSPLVPCATIDQ